MELFNLSIPGGLEIFPSLMIQEFRFCLVARLSPRNSGSSEFNGWEIKGEENILASHLPHPKPDTHYFYSHSISKN